MSADKRRIDLLEKQILDLKHELARLSRPQHNSWILGATGGAGGRFFLTPEGGIPAMTGTLPGPLTPGFANCKEYEYYIDGTTDKLRIKDPEVITEVQNGVGAPIGGNTIVLGFEVETRWVVTVEGCNVTIPPDPEPEDPPPDPPPVDPEEEVPPP